MTSSRIDLNRMQVFRAIVLAGSLTKAALQLRLPKSKVSRQLAALEGEIGSQLIYRTTRQLQLTNAGKELFQTAIPHLNELEGALDRVTLGSEEISGQLRITVPDDVGTELMGGICHSFLVMYPKVLLKVKVSNERVDLVRESFDLALRIGRLKDSTLIQKKVGSIHLRPYLSVETNAKYGPVSSPNDLSDIPFLDFSALDEARRKTLKFHRGVEARSIPVQVAFVSNNFFVLRELAIKGLGFTVLPRFLADNAVSRGQLIALPRDWLGEGVPVQIVMPSQKDVPARTRKFIGHLQAQLAPHLAS